MSQSSFDFVFSHIFTFKSYTYYVCHSVHKPTIIIMLFLLVALFLYQYIKS